MAILLGSIIYSNLYHRIAFIIFELTLHNPYANSKFPKLSTLHAMQLVLVSHVPLIVIDWQYLHLIPDCDYSQHGLHLTSDCT